MVTSDVSMNEEGTLGDVYDMDNRNEYIIVWDVIVMPRRRMGIFPFSLDCIGKTDLQMIHSITPYAIPRKEHVRNMGLNDDRQTQLFLH